MEQSFNMGKKLKKLFLFFCKKGSFLQKKTCFVFQKKAKKNSKQMLFKVYPMPSALLFFQFLSLASLEHSCNFQKHCSLFFCFENCETNQNSNNSNNAEISEPKMTKPVLLNISKDKIVHFPSLQNSEQITSIIQQTFDHSLIPLPFKYAKLPFDLYNRMIQSVSFETF